MQPLSGVASEARPNQPQALLVKQAQNAETATPRRARPRNPASSHKSTQPTIRTPPGPQSRLDDTTVAQPALLIADLAAAAALEARAPEAAARAGAAAGLSLGEYAALTWAGAMSFEDALKVGGGADPFTARSQPHAPE